jgi:hypothetical protein
LPDLPSAANHIIALNHIVAARDKKRDIAE